MATSIVESVTGADLIHVSQNPDQRATQLSRESKVENKCSGGFAMFTSPPSGSFNYNSESTSSGYKYDFPTFSTQNKDKMSESLDITNRDGNQNTAYLEQNQITRKSRAGTYTFENNQHDSVYQQRSVAELASQFSKEALIGNNSDICKMSSTSAFENCSDNTWDYKNDYSSFSYDKTSKSGAYEMNKPKYDQFLSSDLNSGDYKSKFDQLLSSDLNSGDYKSKSQTFDFELMKQTYSFDAAKDASHSEQIETDTAKIKLPSRPNYDFEATDLAMRLRSSVHSDFLSSELRPANASVPEEPKYEPSSALRTIEEILKMHGISDKVPRKNNTAADNGSNMLATSSQVGHTNASQNNETSSTVVRTSGSGSSTAFSSAQDKDATHSFSASANKSMNTPYRTDTKTSSAYMDPKNLTTPGTGFTVNISQNNETTKSQGSSESDPLRKFGSSVDYSGSGRTGMNSGNASFRMFDYGKSMSFSGDNSRPSAMTFSGENSRPSIMTYSTMESKQFEGNIDMNKFDKPQVDHGNSPFSVAKATPLEIIKNMGSATDALQYSMLTERQRLRKLDTMISATPFNYPSLELPRSLRAQYMSPERGYSTLRSSDLAGRRIYSTSTIPSSSGHGAGPSHRNNLASNVGQRDSTTALSKSISAPGSGAMNVQSAGTHGSSVDARAPYWSYGSKRDYNMQQNNAYNPQLLEKLASQKNGSNNQKKPAANKKRECPLKHNKDAHSAGNDNQSFYSQTPTGINFLNSTRGVKSSAANQKRYGVKSETKRSVDRKKNADRDFNHSKNIGSIHDGFDFVKDLNRMWQETVFGTPAKSAQNQKPQKYTPYKPVTPSQDKKEAKTGGSQTAREKFSTDFMPLSARMSDSNWTLGGSAATGGKFHGYDSDMGFKSIQKVRSQCSLQPQSSIQTKSKCATSASVKPKAKAPIGKKQATTVPKSILKQPSAKATTGTSSNISRPHSAMATSSKSFTQSAYQLPYQLIRGFSPVDPHKPSRAHMSTSVKKSDPSVKRKPVSRAPATPKHGRRL